MPVNGFSVGRDLTLNVVTPKGQLRFPLSTEFEANPDLRDEKRMGLDGTARHALFHQGWHGTIMFDRGDPNFDDYWAQIEADYYQGLNQGSATITETITEVSGAVKQYLFTGVVLKPTAMGNWKGDQVVAQKIEFLASRRLPL